MKINIFKFLLKSSSVSYVLRHSGKLFNMQGVNKMSKPHYVKSSPRSMKKEATVGLQVVDGGHRGKQFFKRSYHIHGVTSPSLTLDILLEISSR